MMLRIALRLQRGGLIAVTAVGAAIGSAQAAGFTAAAGKTAAERLQFAHSMELIARQLSYLLPIPDHVETMGGYVQWRAYGTLPIFFAVWAALSAAGAVRGDEEKGLIERWLASGVSAAGYVGWRLVAFAIAAAIAVGATGIAAWAGSLSSTTPLSLASIAETSAALLGLAVCCMGIALFLAQVPATRRAAGGLAALVLIGIFLVESLSRTTPSLEPWAKVVSPFYYFDIQRPLAPGGEFNPVATIGLVVVGVAFAALAAVIARNRDVGAPLLRRRAREHAPVWTPSRNPMLRWPVLGGLYEQRVGIAIWTASAAVFAMFIVSVAQSTIAVVRDTPSLRGYLSAAGGGSDAAIVGYMWFGIAQLILAAYIVTVTSRWTSDDAEGRLEMTLSAPVARWRVVIERAAVLLVALAVMIKVSSVALDYAASGQGIHIPAGDLTLASALLVPFGFSFAAAGAALAGLAPRAAVPVLGALTAASYLLIQLGPLFRWPDWVLNLSVFKLFGTPLTSGVYWSGLWTMLGIIVVGFGLGLWTMSRREVSR